MTQTYSTKEQQIDMLVKKVQQRGNFAMYTPSGDEYVRKLILTTFTKIQGSKKFGPVECEKYLRDRKNKAPERYSEVWDTEPSNYIDAYVSQMLELCGYQPMD